MREFPSKWTPVGLYRERNCNVRIIDFFKIEKKPGQIITNDNPIKITNKLHKINFGKSNLLDVNTNDCIHGEEVACSNILHKTIHSPDSIGDYGEDITIERGILNWCDEHKVPKENKLLESARARCNCCNEPSNLNNKPEISLMVDSRTPIYHPKEVFMQYFPALWDCLASSSSRHTPTEHEPPLWDTDVSIVLCDEPIGSCVLEKAANSEEEIQSLEGPSVNEMTVPVFPAESGVKDMSALHPERSLA